MDVNDILTEKRKEKKDLLKSAMYNKEKLENEKSKKVKNDYYINMNTAYLRITRTNLEIDNICSKIKENSKFNVEEIGAIVSDLVTIFEGEKFTYKLACYEPSNWFVLITSDEKDQKYFRKQQMYSIRKKGDALIFPVSNIFSEASVYFYTADKMHRVNQTVGFGKFSYVKEFIDELILYKIKNNKEYLSPEEMEELKYNFIKSRVDDIQKKYEENSFKKIGNAVEEVIYKVKHDRAVNIRHLKKYK